MWGGQLKYTSSLSSMQTLSQLSLRKCPGAVDDLSQPPFRGKGGHTPEGWNTGQPQISALIKNLCLPNTIRNRQA